VREKGKKATTRKSHMKFQIGRNIVLILREEDFLEFKVWEKGICYLRPNGNWIKVQICKGFEENLKRRKTKGPIVEGKLEKQLNSNLKIEANQINKFNDLNNDQLQEIQIKLGEPRRYIEEIRESSQIKLEELTGKFGNNIKNTQKL